MPVKINYFGEKAASPLELLTPKDAPAAAVSQEDVKALGASLSDAAKAAIMSGMGNLDLTPQAAKQVFGSGFPKSKYTFKGAAMPPETLAALQFMGVSNVAGWVVQPEKNAVEVHHEDGAITYVAQEALEDAIAATGGGGGIAADVIASSDTSGMVKSVTMQEIIDGTVTAAKLQIGSPPPPPELIAGLHGIEGAITGVLQKLPHPDYIGEQANKIVTAINQMPGKMPHESMGWHVDKIVSAIKEAKPTYEPMAWHVDKIVGAIDALAHAPGLTYHESVGGQLASISTHLQTMSIALEQTMQLVATAMGHQTGILTKLAQTMEKLVPEPEIHYPQEVWAYPDPAPAKKPTKVEAVLAGDLQPLDSVGAIHRKMLSEWMVYLRNVFAKPLTLNQLPTWDGVAAELQTTPKGPQFFKVRSTLLKYQLVIEHELTLGENIADRRIYGTERLQDPKLKLIP